MQDRKHEVLAPTPCLPPPHCVTLGKLFYISSLLFFQLQDAAIHPFPIYKTTHEIQVIGPTTIYIVANSGET